MASRVFRQAALDRLSSPEQLDQLVRVTGPQGWSALAVLTGVLTAALLWGWFGSIPIEATGEGILQAGKPAMASSQGGDLQAVLFLPADQDREVSAGMEVHLLPAGPRSEEYGFLRGEVRRVATVPGKNPWLKVEVALQRDPTAPAGNRWPSSVRTDRELLSGTRITGRIVVQRKRPLELLIPGLQEP